MTTLLELRHSVGKRLGDLTLVEATQNGTDGIFYDNLRLLGTDNSYKGRWIYFTGGTVANIGSMRKILTSTYTGGTLNISPSLPAATATGDDAEIWGIHGQGWTPQEVNDTIIDVHYDAMSNFFVPVQASVTDVFDSGDGFLVLPAALTVGIFEVEVESLSGAWNSVDRANNRGAPGYWTTRGLGKVIIGGDYWLNSMNGMNVRILGYGTGDTFAEDDDVSLVNREYLVWESVYRLLFAGLERSPERNKSMLPVAMQECKVQRERARMRPAPDWQRV